jgi:heat shock protein HslJ
MPVRSYLLAALSVASLGAASLGSGSAQAQNGPPGRDLMGRQWRLSSMTGGSTSMRNRPTLSFNSPSNFSGTTGCNRISGTWSVAGGVLTLNRMGPARRGCASHALSIQESRYLAALQTADQYAVQQRALVLTTPSGQRLVFH